MREDDGTVQWYKEWYNENLPNEKVSKKEPDRIPVEGDSLEEYLNSWGRFNFVP